MDVVRLARRLRDEGTTLAGSSVAEPPRYLIGVADLPLAEPYEPARLEAKLDAGAEFVMTQIVFDVERFAAWAEMASERGLLRRAHVIVGVSPPASERSLRFIANLPGVSVPDAVFSRLKQAGEDAAAEGVRIGVEIVNGLRSVDGVSGVHVIGLGRDASVRALVREAGLFPRPTR